MDVRLKIVAHFVPTLVMQVHLDDGSAGIDQWMASKRNNRDIWENEHNDRKHQTHHILPLP